MYDFDILVEIEKNLILVSKEKPTKLIMEDNNEQFIDIHRNCNDHHISHNLDSCRNKIDQILDREPP